MIYSNKLKIICEHEPSCSQKEIRYWRYLNTTEIYNDQLEVIEIIPDDSPLCLTCCECGAPAAVENILPEKKAIAVKENLQKVLL